MFPQRLLRDHRFGLLSAESQIVYGQIWRRAELRAPEGADVLGVVVSSCVALGPDPRRRAEAALAELRKAGLLLEQPDGALLPAHAPAARGIPAAGAVPQLRPDQLGPKGGNPGWLRTRLSRQRTPEEKAALAAQKAEAAAKRAAAKNTAAQVALPLDPPPTSPAPPPAEPVTPPVTATVSVTGGDPSPAVSGDVSGVARAHPLSPPPGLLEKPRGREGDAPECGAEQRPCDGPGNGSRNGPPAPGRRSAEELARLDRAALGRLFLDVLRERKLGKHFELTPPVHNLAGLGQVIADAAATEEELRALAAYWEREPDKARAPLRWDSYVRGGGRVKVTFLLGKRLNGVWAGKSFHDLISDTRAWMERVREAKAQAAAAPHQHVLGIPENPTATTGPPGVARAGDVSTRARASGDGSG